MQLTLSPLCPIFREDSRHELIRLLELVLYKRWHLIVRPDLTTLRGRLGPQLWAQYGEFLLQRYKLITTERGCRFGPALCDACDPKRLVDYLELDVKLLVENATTDGAFFRMAIQHFRPPLTRLLKHPRVVEIMQAGGIGELQKLARMTMEHRAPLILEGAPARVVAICDSDARAPHAPCAAARALAADAAARGYGAHVLEKRSIENYIPDAALMEYADVRAHSRAAVDYILTLGRIARDHYPMKDGLDERDVATGLFPDEAPLGLGVGDFAEDLLTHFNHCIETSDWRARDYGDELGDVMRLLEEHI